MQSSLLASQQQQQHIGMEKQIDPETTGKPAGICLLSTDADEFKKDPFFMTFSLFEKEKPFQLKPCIRRKKNLY